VIATRRYLACLAVGAVCVVASYACTSVTEINEIVAVPDGGGDAVGADSGRESGPTPVDEGSEDGGEASGGGRGVDVVVTPIDAAQPPGDGALPDATTGPCQGGQYQGLLEGTYTSHLTGVGLPIPLKGTVDLTLDPEGTAQMTCTLGGEAGACSNLLIVRNGSTTGTAGSVGDTGTGGFPFFCTMSGTLDCSAQELVDGWLECTYCVGPVADGGMGCALLGGVGGTTGVGGHFAGPLTASYDDGTHALVMGTWNGAEALAGNDGGSPTPDGGPISNYLSDSGDYFGPNDFGGSGTWNAAYGNGDP
jgi:hypothetical protein